MTDVLRMMIGPLVWLASFSAVYGLHGLACAFGWGGINVWGLSLLRAALVAAWAMSIALQVAILAALHSQRLSSPSRFGRRVSRTLGWVGLFAAIWTLFPVAATSSCNG